MKNNTTRAAQEAWGCFLMLIVGTILLMIALTLVLTFITEPRGEKQNTRWFIGALAGGTIIMAWLTYRFKNVWNRNNLDKDHSPRKAHRRRRR